MNQFPILSYSQLVDIIKNFDIAKYCKTRNYIKGSVSKLSPYITHGVITIQEIIELSMQQISIQDGDQWYKELMRREFFIQVHFRKKNEIFHDMESDKTNIAKTDILPINIINKNFTSDRINKIILQLEDTGYLHNHQRMRLASYMTHRQKLYWKKLADRSYHHFIDGELSSNHLSRQRVSSNFSNKPYFMNGKNIQKYWYNASDPIYDGSYEDIEKKIFDPKRLQEVYKTQDVFLELKTDLSKITNFSLESFVANDIIILTPWDLHYTKIQYPQKTICFFDTKFFAKHSWSNNRIHRLIEYCKLYGIKTFQGDLDVVLKTCIKNDISITSYHTHNPFYREAQEKYKQNINLYPIKRFSSISTKFYSNRFFKFWQNSQIDLYKLNK